MNSQSINRQPVRLSRENIFFIIFLSFILTILVIDIETTLRGWSKDSQPEIKQTEAVVVRARGNRR